MIAILTATLMVSTVAGYVLNQEAQANVYANGGNANGGNANGGNAGEVGNANTPISGTDAGTGGNGDAAGPGGVAICITDNVPC